MKIDIKNIYKSYHLKNRNIPVLQDISLSIESGDFVALTGVSGIGKSTLLHLIGTLDKPDQGEICWGGQDVLQCTQEEICLFRNEKIGFIFQFHYLLSELSAVENVMVPLLIQGKRKNFAESRAASFLEKVGLLNRTRHRPSELSGGEQQRVALARALVLEPKLLLADEPSGNLDDASGYEIFDLIKEINGKNKMTTIFVTHHTNLANMAPKRFSLSGKGIERLK